MIVPKVMYNHIRNTLLNMEWLKHINSEIFFSSKANNVFVLMLLYYFYVAIKDDSKNFTFKQKSLMLIIFFLTYGFTSGILYIACAPVGADYVLGYQLRYIFPIVPLIMMCVSNKSLKSNSDTNFVMKITIVQNIFIAVALLGEMLK